MSATNMYLRELAERAALLLRLQHDRAYVKARLHANVAWDFEVSGRPAFAGQIDKLVDDVFTRAGVDSAAAKKKGK